MYMYIVGVLFSISSGSFKVIPPLIMYISIRNQYCGGGGGGGGEVVQGDALLL